MKKIIRVFSVGIVFTMLVQDLPLLAADPTPAAATSPAPAIAGAKDPLIEVSVDSLEISETNANAIGFIWGDTSADNQLNFIEHSIPSIFDFGHLERANQIKVRLDAMIKNDQIRVLANPTLVTKSGFEANFLVGGEIPYPTPAPVGQAPGVEFKKYGVTLKILPVITPRQTIEAQLNVGVSNPDNSLGTTINGTLIPALSSREAGSKVEVKDGETVVMAGIKTSRHDTTIIKVPVLGSIPLIGLLFRHKAETVTQTSLVLFVTFRIVKSN